MLEAMTQAQNARNNDIDMMVQSLHSHRLASSDVGNHSVRAEESVVLEIKVPFQNNHLNLPKLQILKRLLTVLQVILFLKSNLKMNMIMNLNLVIQFYFLIQ